MAWKAQNIITSIFSPLLFIGMIIAYVYSEVSKTANVFFYLLLICTIISNIVGIIVNLMQIKDTHEHSSKAASGLMIFTTILQALITVLIVVAMISQS
jgi:hypothetical protein